MLHSLKWLCGLLAEVVEKNELRKWDGLLTEELEEHWGIIWQGLKWLCGRRTTLISGFVLHSLKWLCGRRTAVISGYYIP